jgi:hypothetical protein
VVPGRLADLLVVDGDPIEEPALLLDRERIWLVLQLGRAGGGRSARVAPRRGDRARRRRTARRLRRHPRTRRIA